MGSEWIEVETLGALGVPILRVVESSFRGIFFRIARKLTRLGFGDIID